MGQRIGDYRSQLDQMQRAGVEQKPLGLGGEGKLGVREPINAPTGWTKFKAALSHVPLLGKMGSLRQARAEVESYPVRLQQFQVESRQIMAGFVQSLRAEYGNSVADKAMQDIDQTGTTPLTGRSVRTILKNAEDAKKSTQTTNRLSLTRFLESPILGGTGRGPGEKDMVGLLFDRGFKKPENATSWKDFLGENTGNWASTYMTKRLQEHPAYSTGRIPNKDIAQIASEALDIVAEARAQGLSQEQLEHIFESATQENKSAQDIKLLVREFAIRESFLAPQLDRKNPESMLRQTALAVAKEMGLKEVPDAVLKCIETNVKEHVCHTCDKLPAQLKCGEDCTSIKQALAPVLKSKVETLLREHAQALDMIEKSTKLTANQKAILREVASQRRMDPTQIQGYEKFACQMKDGVASFKTAMASQDARTVLQTLQSLKKTFEDSLQEMKRHGNDIWEMGSIKSGDTATKMMEDMVGMAFADMTPEESTAFFEAMTSDSAKAVLTGFRQSPDPEFSFMPMMCAVILTKVAQKAGIQPDVLDKAMSAIGKDVPITQTSVTAMLLATGTERDYGCVDRMSKHHQMVSRDFSAQKFRAAHTQDMLLPVNSSAVDQNGLAKAFNDDLGRCSMILNGQKLTELGDGNTQRSTQAFLQSFTNRDGVVDMKLACTVSKCFNQRGIHGAMEGMVDQALKGATLLGTNKTVNEAWRNEDGSWTVRCTSRKDVTHLSPPFQEGVEQHPEELAPNSYVLGSVTYNISAESINQGNPQISIVDSRVFFSF